MFRGSSAAERRTVNPQVAGSIPAPGAMSERVWCPTCVQSKNHYESSGFLLPAWFIWFGKKFDTQVCAHDRDGTRNQTKVLF